MFCWPCITVTKFVISNTKLIHTSLFTLLRFTVSTCFVHYLPILRRHYTNAGLVTVVWGCRCGLVSGCGKTTGSVNLNKVKSEVCINLVLLITKLCILCVCYKITQRFIQLRITLTLFCHVRPAKHLTKTGVAACHKHVGDPWLEVLLYNCQL
jgi:hypothetical protein